MTEHNPGRRTFLVHALIGTGAMAAAELAPAQNKEARNETNAPAQLHSETERQGAFFNRSDAATVAAFAERLMPGAPGKPGAHDAGVVNYIDLALSGAYADLQDFYRRGLAQVDAYCRKTYNDPFGRLEASRQDEVITALEEGKATGFTWPKAPEFFNTIRTQDRK